MHHRLPTELRQATIVAAALQLASQTSPGAITTADIARAVGVSQGALFKHFPSKSAMWEAVLAWVHAALLERLRGAIAQADTPLAALAAAWSAHVGFVMEHPGVPRLLFHELQEPNDSPLKQAVRRLLQDYRQCLQPVLRQGVAQGQLRRTLDTDAALTLLLGSLQGLVMQSMLHQQPALFQSQAQQVFALALHALHPLQETP